MAEKSNAKVIINKANQQLFAQCMVVAVNELQEHCAAIRAAATELKSNENVDGAPTNGFKNSVSTAEALVANVSTDITELQQVANKMLEATGMTFDGKSKKFDAIAKDMEAALAQTKSSAQA